ncbi:uncharacterized protein LOC141735283 [Larus michahellis]|uniref:uncharacterized protein LOC141735283 n=1 Tax=Larus michahellis TaxID=119627 RepID=UPI003D9ACA00
MSPLTSSLTSGAGSGAEPSESSPEPPPPPPAPGPAPPTPAPPPATSPRPLPSATPPPSQATPPPAVATPPLPQATPPPAAWRSSRRNRPPPPASPPGAAAPPGPTSLSPDSEEGRPLGRPLGTLRGVAAPALQTLLGLVLVLRLPWLVGTGGVLQAAAIALLLGACTVLTSVSLSAIATNGLDPRGGALGLLTGGLGPAAGGAVGLCAFLSAAFAAAAAALGAAEILLEYVTPWAGLLPGRGNNGRGLGAGLLGLLGAGAAAPPFPPPLSRLLPPLGPAGLLLALLGC